MGALPDAGARPPARCSRWTRSPHDKAPARMHEPRGGARAAPLSALGSPTRSRRSREIVGAARRRRGGARVESQKSCRGHGVGDDDPTMLHVRGDEAKVKAGADDARRGRGKSAGPRARRAVAVAVGDRRGREDRDRSAAEGQGRDSAQTTSVDRNRALEQARSIVLAVVLALVALRSAALVLTRRARDQQRGRPPRRSRGTA